MLFPIKSLDGVSVKSAEAILQGSLYGDRQYALFKDDDTYFNGKRSAALHRLRSHHSVESKTVKFGENSFHLPTERDALERWISQYFGVSLGLCENAHQGFPDDYKNPGPTLISVATLQTIASWFSLPVESVRKRLRTNIEIDGVAPFWEDQMVAHRFRMGHAAFEGRRISSRCVVPSRDAETGQVLSSFQKKFAEKRRETLPPGSPTAQFDHFYRVAINTQIIDAGRIQCGDTLQWIT